VKKILGVSALTLVAACLIAPKFIANEYQTKLTDFIDNINSEAGYSAKIESTESSWFGSTSKVLVNIDTTTIAPTLQGKKLSAEFELDTQFGPLLFAPQGVIGLFSTDVKLKGDEQRHYLNWGADTPLYTLSLISNLFGDLQFADYIPAFSNKAQTLSVSEYSGHGKLANGKLIYNGGFKAATASEQTTTTLQNVTLNLDLDADWATIRSEGFYNGNMGLNIEQITTVPQGEFDKLAVTLKTKLDDSTQLGSMQIGYAIKKIDVDGFQANDLNLVTELNNLDNQVFLDYGQLIKESVSLTPNQQFAFLQQHLDTLLAGKPEFNIVEFSGETKDGKFTANLASHLADIKNPSIAEMNDPRFWLYNAIVNANVKMDQTLLHSAVQHYVAKKMYAPLNAPEVKQQSDILIDSLVQQGIIKLENNNYSTQFHAEKGQGKIYDLAFPLM